MDFCPDGCIHDPVFNTSFPIIERFLAEVPKIWISDGWYPGPRSEKRFPNIDGVDMCFGGRKNQIFTFNQGEDLWRYKSYDGFQNLANPEYLHYEKNNTIGS